MVPRRVSVAVAVCFFSCLWHSCVHLKNNFPSSSYPHRLLRRPGFPVTLDGYRDRVGFPWVSGGMGTRAGLSGLGTLCFWVSFGHVYVSGRLFLWEVSFHSLFLSFHLLVCIDFLILSTFNYSFHQVQHVVIAFRLTAVSELELPLARVEMEFPG